MSKWITVNDVHRPAAEVAAEILQQRIQAVEQRLPLAAFEYQHDVEHVHQLRVGCRRAGAALAAFRPLIGRKSKRLRKWLRRLRRAAGPARDSDVLLLRLRAEPTTAIGHEYLVARLQHRRADAQQALVDVAERAAKRAAKGSLSDSLQRCLTALHKHASAPPDVPPNLPFDAFARQALRAASRKMFKRASQQQPSVAQLHQLRIAGKRLRYSIELFHSAFPTALRKDVYPLVENIQSRLGQLNDHDTALTLFQQWQTDLPPGEQVAQLTARIAEEQHSIEQVRTDFLQWWTPERAATLESTLESHLGQP